jgi:hypothetical protein
VANVFLVEDRPSGRRIVKRGLEGAGHSVTEAETLEAALAIVDQLDSLKIHVAIVDGNLTLGDSSGNDGAKIAQAIRAKNPAIKIITWSSSRIYRWGDVSVEKRGLTPDEMQEILRQVTAMLPFPRTVGSDKVVREDEWFQDDRYGYCPACGSIGIEEIAIPGDEVGCFYCSDATCITIMGDREQARTKWNCEKPPEVLGKEEAGGWSWNEEHFPGQTFPMCCPD